MTTLIAVYNSEGCVGRCDAKCYNAHEANCDCICGGANHGAGLDQALANVSDAFEQMLEDYGKEHEFSEVEVPAIYAARTRTAVHIAREINKQAGCNAVKNVERIKDDRGRLCWAVTTQVNGQAHTNVYPNSQTAIAQCVHHAGIAQF